MRIYEPKNHLNRRLINDTEFLPSSIKVDRGIVNGVVTIDSTVLEDVENWEVASVSVMMNGELQAFGADAVRQEDGSIEVVFGEPDEHLDFGQASIVLNRKYGNAHYAPQELTLEMRINRQMVKTLKAAGKPGYDKDANIEEWNLLAQEAYNTDPVKYNYAVEKNFSKFIEGPVINDSLLSINTFKSPVKPVPGLDSVIWNSDLPSMVKTDTYTIFESGPELKEWNGLMPNLEDGSYMFSNCCNLESVVTELPSLVNGTSMFTSTVISSFDIQLPNLTNAEEMFSNCHNLISWDIDFPKVVNATHMFSGCSGLTSWTVELPAGLQSARGMFAGCTGLTSWTVELPKNLTSTGAMFSRCTGLTSWTVELPDSITNTSSMFYNCRGLSSWNVDLPVNTANAIAMFQNCTGLTSFSGDLSHISSASQMFFYCTSLSSFNGGPEGLKSLSDGSYMFKSCKLDYASIQHIADTLPVVTGTHYINIGYDSTKITQAQLTACENTIVRVKKWSLSWEASVL